MWESLFAQPISKCDSNADQRRTGQGRHTHIPLGKSRLSNPEIRTHAFQRSWEIPCRHVRVMHAAAAEIAFSEREKSETVWAGSSSSSSSSSSNLCLYLSFASGWKLRKKDFERERTKLRVTDYEGLLWGCACPSWVRCCCSCDRPRMASGDNNEEISEAEKVTKNYHNKNHHLSPTPQRTTDRQ